MKSYLLRVIAEFARWVMIDPSGFFRKNKMEQFNWAQEKINNLTETQQNERRKFQEMMREQLQPVESNLDQYENRAQRREREKQEKRNRSKLHSRA